MRQQKDMAERIKMVKAMEFIAWQINDPEIFSGWREIGIAAGGIKYGDLQVNKGDEKDLSGYLKDEDFADLMDAFLLEMAKAKKSGGLYCDHVVSRPK